MDEKPGEKVLQAALRIAKARFPEVRGENAGGWTDLARLLSHSGVTITPQQIWNWRNRDGRPSRRDSVDGG